MDNYKKHTHIGVYGLLIEDNKILLIKKKVGPYAGTLDLPGGSFEFGETPEQTLIREFKEETNLDLEQFTLIDTDSKVVDWHSEHGLIKVHHIGIFYKITKYKNSIKKQIKTDEHNDDSLGAEFYDINKLSKDDLSAITIMELTKLGCDNI